mgnify:FL=1|jgi:predicted DNA-binding protein YlxM (UPF0122 family)
MFEKDMRLSYLLDFYADALDDRTRDIMKAYYDDDLSLAEIAEGESISRQGVRHIIKKGEEQLDFLEQKLGLASHYSALSEMTKKLDAVRETLLLEGERFKNEADIIKDAVSVILSKGI